MFLLSVFCFFFQAEDGIRDWSVTGVQTCALPILDAPNASAAAAVRKPVGGRGGSVGGVQQVWSLAQMAPRPQSTSAAQIGRASCRERVEISVGAGARKKQKNKDTRRKHSR